MFLAFLRPWCVRALLLLVPSGAAWLTTDTEELTSPGGPRVPSAADREATDRLNRVRGHFGLEPLRNDERLFKVARAGSVQAVTGTPTSLRRNLAGRLADEGYRGLAWEFETSHTWARDPEWAVYGWMNTYHRETLLSPRINTVGISRIHDWNGKKCVWTVVVGDDTKRAVEFEGRTTEVPVGATDAEVADILTRNAAVWDEAERLLAEAEPTAVRVARLKGGMREAEFQRWYRGWVLRAALQPDPDIPEQSYDFRSAFRAGAVPTQDARGGWTWPSIFLRKSK